jgi:hypothetical protein
MTLAGNDFGHVVRAVLNAIDRRPDQRYKVATMIAEVYGEAAVDKPYDVRNPADKELQSTTVRRAMTRAAELRPWFRFEYGEIFDGTRRDLYSAWYEPAEVDQLVSRATALKRAAGAQRSDQGPSLSPVAKRGKIRTVEPPRRIQAKFQALRTLLSIEATDNELEELVAQVKAERRKKA